ncbi:MAG: hypothetical protein Kow0073_10760 [Immundisolibacter sp.]
MSAVDKLKAGWRQRPARERRLLVLAAGVLLALAGDALVWSPWQATRARLAADNARLTADLAWLRGLAPRAQALRAQQRKPTPATGALGVRLDASLRAAGFGAQLQRLEPAPDGSARLWLDDAPFDGLVGWLAHITAEGVTVERFVATPGAFPGQVDARLSLRD